jgi:hypothetical protein
MQQWKPPLSMTKEQSGTMKEMKELDERIQKQGSSCVDQVTGVQVPSKQSWELDSGGPVKTPPGFDTAPYADEVTKCNLMTLPTIMKVCTLHRLVPTFSFVGFQPSASPITGLNGTCSPLEETLGTGFWWPSPNPLCFDIAPYADDVTKCKLMALPAIMKLCASAASDFGIVGYVPSAFPITESDETAMSLNPQTTNRWTPTVLSDVNSL